MTPTDAKARGAAGQAQSEQQVRHDNIACLDAAQAGGSVGLRISEAIAPAGTRRLPPYGRKLLGLRAQGLAPTVAVLILDGWAPATNLDEYAPWILVVLDDLPAAHFDFRCVAGLFVFVVAERLARADEIVVQVFRFSPRAVYAWTDELRSLAFYTRELP